MADDTLLRVFDGRMPSPAQTAAILEFTAETVNGAYTEGKRAGIRDLLTTLEAEVAGLQGVNIEASRNIDYSDREPVGYRTVTADYVTIAVTTAQPDSGMVDRKQVLALLANHRGEARDA